LKGVSEEFRVADWSFLADSQVPVTVKALHAYALSHGTPGSPDCRKVTTHQTDFSRGFLKADSEEQPLLGLKNGQVEQVSVHQEAVKPSRRKKIVHKTDASKESSKAEAWHQRLSVPPLTLPQNGEKGLTLTQSEDKSVRQEDQGTRVL
jgi:hypothetical protein